MEEFFSPLPKKLIEVNGDNFNDSIKLKPSLLKKISRKLSKQSRKLSKKRKSKKTNRKKIN